MGSECWQLAVSAKRRVTAKGQAVASSIASRQHNNSHGDHVVENVVTFFDTIWNCQNSTGARLTPKRQEIERNLTPPQKQRNRAHVARAERQVASLP